MTKIKLTESEFKDLVTNTVINAIQEAQEKKKLREELSKAIGNVLTESLITEKWAKDAEVKKTGEHAGKTIDELQSELSKLKKKSKTYQDKGQDVPESIKDQEKEIIFAIRAKKGWKGSVNEDTSDRISLDDLIKISEKAGTYVMDAEDALNDLGVIYGENGVPKSEVERTLAEYDMSLEELENDYDQYNPEEFKQADDEKGYELTFSKDSGMDYIKKAEKILDNELMLYDIKDKGNFVEFVFADKADFDMAYDFLEREGYFSDKDTFNEEAKPSAGLTKAQKSDVVKSAKAGEDIGKKGKGFAKVVKAAKERGAKDPEAVAGSVMWKNIKR